MRRRINSLLGGLLIVALLAVSFSITEDNEAKAIDSSLEVEGESTLKEGGFYQDFMKKLLQKRQAVRIEIFLENLKRNAEEKHAAEQARLAEEARVNRVRVPMEHEGWYITAEYENVDSIHYVPHTGIDFGNGPSYGWSAFPAAKGIVTWAGWGGVWPGCGYWVAVYHEQFDETTIYCHLESTYVNIGDFVDPDTALGEIGNTGYSFGIHLHFGVYRGNQFVENHYNPRDFFGKFDIVL